MDRLLLTDLDRTKTTTPIRPRNVDIPAFPLHVTSGGGMCPDFQHSQLGMQPFQPLTQKFHPSFSHAKHASTAATMSKHVAL